MLRIVAGPNGAGKTTLVQAHPIQHLIYVTVVSPEVACQRVARRVRAGGHDVPVEKVQARWHRSLSNLARFAARGWAFWVFDNSDERPEVPPRLVATGRLGVVEILDPSAGNALLSSLSTLPRTPNQ